MLCLFFLNSPVTPISENPKGFWGLCRQNTKKLGNDTSEAIQLLEHPVLLNRVANLFQELSMLTRLMSESWKRNRFLCDTKTVDGAKPQSGDNVQIG